MEELGGLVIDLAVVSRGRCGAVLDPLSPVVWRGQGGVTKVG